MSEKKAVTKFCFFTIINGGQKTILVNFAQSDDEKIDEV